MRNNFNKFQAQARRSALLVVNIEYFTEKLKLIIIQITNNVNFEIV